jgi:uncharacterized protein (TIGR02996 family)
VEGDHVTTTDDVALLAAICAEPAEDTPRLAYADWLDERGDARVTCGLCKGQRHVTYFKGPGATNPNWKDCPVCGGTGTVVGTANADRAEFIRVQIALANRNGNWIEAREEIRRKTLLGQMSHDQAAILSAVADTRPDSLQARSDELLRQHADAWRPEVLRGLRTNIIAGGLTNVVDITFSRGFVSHVTCTAAQWTANRERRVDVGECPNCKGGGYVAIYAQYDPAGADISPNGYYDPCPACSGTGRLTRGDGFAARVVLACPVAGVTLSDREPGGEADERGDRYWVRRLAHWTMADHPHHLPPELFDRLEGGTTREDLQVRSSHYDSPDAARQALSDACVAWARAEAGLPATETTA